MSTPAGRAVIRRRRRKGRKRWHLLLDYQPQQLFQAAQAPEKIPIHDFAMKTVNVFIARILWFISAKGMKEHPLPAFAVSRKSWQCG